MYNPQNNKENEMKNMEKNPDFEDIIFEGRNKEYGAYALRRIYNKYISISTTGGAILFALIVSYPLITASLFKEDVVENDKPNTRIIEFDKVDIPSIDKPPVDIPTPIQPKTPTIKYVAPVVLPDEQVHNDDFATIDDLINKNPGTKTVEGDINGTDDIEIIEPTTPEIIEPVKEQIHTWAEEMPKFSGGDKELLSFFAQNIVYPEIAKRAGVEGKVILTFVIDKNGEVKDVQVAKGIGAGCDEEAMRVLKIMPRWHPGKQNGKPVLTRINIPVVFKLK
jgi:protein TonB